MIVHHDFYESANTAQAQEDPFENTWWIGLSQLKLQLKVIPMEGIRDGSSPQVYIHQGPALGSVSFKVSCVVNQPIPTYLLLALIMRPELLETLG